MAIFGRERDYQFVLKINRELLGRVINQQVGYYKISLEETTSNIYGESLNKKYKNPVLFNCLIERGDFSENTSDLGTDVIKSITVRFLRLDLVKADVYPEIGDVLLWNEHYYEVNNKNENQFWVGKDPEYSYTNTTEYFGGNVSTILNCHYIRPESLGLTQQR